ncbi:EamA-like transporter family protein [Seinonella peptonophila]|uniref:EamA-like transporter family protein n=1 Tax=Seinonella peptonophila TaxID=112248 RepID=A0A1M4ST52_9BACL|nr:DMT family transporter [Seinonella peptonophila]SHE35423.1 EamA-like transporter family protein [Seinonella peptonophila]
MTKRKAELCLLLLALIWGSTFVLMEDAIKSVPPFAFLTIRFAIASVCLIFIVIFIRRTPIMCKSIWLLGFVLGGLLALGFALQILSLLSTTSGNSAFFNSAVVVIVPVFSFLLLSTPLTTRLIFSLAIVMFGLYLLSGSQLGSMNHGDFLAFLGAFPFAVHIVCIKKWGTTLPVFSLVAIQMIFATFFCGLATLLWEPWQKVLAPNVISQPSVWIAITICSLLATIGAYLMLAYLQRYTTPNRAALILTTEPVFAAGIDYMWNQVTITDWRLLGCFLIIVGIIWGQQEKKMGNLNSASSA